MTAWVDYTFYTESYLAGRSPTMSVDDFPHYAVRATATVRRYTLDNISDDDVPDAAKYAVCAVSDALYSYDKNSSGIGVTSEKTGDLSVTYASGAERKKALDVQIRDVVYTYLVSGGYLFCGVAPC